MSKPSRFSIKQRTWDHTHCWRWRGCSTRPRGQWIPMQARRPRFRKKEPTEPEEEVAMESAAAAKSIPFLLQPDRKPLPFQEEDAQYQEIRKRFDAIQIIIQLLIIKWPYGNILLQGNGGPIQENWLVHHNAAQSNKVAGPVQESGAQFKITSAHSKKVAANFMIAAAQFKITAGPVQESGGPFLENGAQLKITAAHSRKRRPISRKRRPISRKRRPIQESGAQFKITAGPVQESGGPFQKSGGPI
ncbi:hypothetical protein Cni_G18264 [Canna indica]|uniref:Uncharacterized protein n=1 Tax=Canna indica TaxID=4628 RepID=A0AAQ3QHC5_9LILI|nr:hypothetical protein Cni_G18264 [Canna indica]